MILYEPYSTFMRELYNSRVMLRSLIHPEYRLPLRDEEMELVLNRLETVVEAHISENRAARLASTSDPED